MKKSVLALTAICISSLAILGCMTTKTTNPTTGAVTVTVNTNNLTLDASVLQAATAVSVSLLVAKDPSVVGPLKSAHVALDGILNGANQMTTQEVLAMLKAQNNPALAAEVTSLIGTASALEQNLLQKYGAEVAGQITLALVKAADAGIVVGLAGK